MSLRTVPRRRTYRQSVAGMKHCQACGQFYTPSAMVCPVCFPAGGTNLAAAKAMQAVATQPVQQPTVKAVSKIFALEPLPKPVYPEWLSAFSDACKYETRHLYFIFTNERNSRLERDTAQAVYCYRCGEHIPDTVNLAAIEGKAITALERARQAEIAPA